MIDLIVFDMAGTVIDEQNVVYKSLHQIIYRSGIDIDFDTVLEIGAGKEKKQAISDIIKKVTGEADPVLVNTLFFEFKEYLLYQYMHLDVVPQPGAEKIFSKLRERGIKITLNTGYDRPTAELLIDKLNWYPHITFDYLITASDVHAGRPAPDMIRQAMAHLTIDSPDRVMKVGDSMIDIEEGRQAGCRFNVGITTGAHSREQLESAGPTHIIHHLEDLLPILDAAFPSAA